MLVEPPPSPADLRFHLLGVPVRIHPMFWICTALLGIRADDAQLLLLWVIAVFLSILVHEFGHVLAYHAFGMRGRIVLYAFGGLAIRETYDSPWQSNYRSPRGDGWPQVAICLAGPAAGFCLAGLVVAILYAANHFILFPWVGAVGQGEPIMNHNLYVFVFYLLWINILWGLVNLLPIYPLDGGQITRELFLLANVPDGIRKSLVVSIAVCVALAGYILIQQQREGLFMGFMCGYLAYQNYQVLQAFSGRSGW